VRTCPSGEWRASSTDKPSGCPAAPDTRKETKATTVRTYTPKPGDVDRQWHVIDATDVVLGRLASQVAVLLRGKHKPTFAPHVDTGDFVVIVNASKVALTGSKAEEKKAYRHSGYPGGLRSRTYTEMLERFPAKAVEKAVKGMLPKNSLAAQQLSKLKVYAGPEHPHQAQQPQPFQITQVAQ
jgi:large subunit ribosomal protein L13